MNSDEVLFLNSLGFGFKRLSFIQENFGSILNIPETSLEDVSRILKTPKELLVRIKERGIDDKVKEIKESLDKLNIKFTTLFDREYPNRLRELPDKPIVLYYKGDISLINSNITCGIVGTRRNDEIGKNYTRKLVDLLVNNKVATISGLARGIDIIVHRRTLEKKGITIAVLAGGLDIVYPPEHKKEFLEIVEKGCVISEFPPGTKHLKRNFFIRNRIISGISDVVVIVQAPEKSGALITGEYALKQRKTLFAIPGNIENPLHRGCNIMIKKGAIPLIDFKDVLEELGYKSSQKSLLQESEITLTEEEKFIYSFITREVTLDEISEATGLPVNQIYPTLLSLELKGLIIQNVGGTFSRTLTS